MKKFKFTLQSVLGLKENMEENEKMLLYGMKAQLNVLYGELEVLDNIYMSCANERKTSSIKGTTGSKLLKLVQYIDEVDKQRSGKQIEIDEILTRIDEQTKVLKQVSTEVKTLEKLKEKQVVLYNEKLGKENELIIEDFISGRMVKSL